MKIFIPASTWVGGTAKFIEKALINLGHEVRMVDLKNQPNFLSKYSTKIIRQISKFRLALEKKTHDDFNRQIINEIESFKPDLFFSLNARFYPETIDYIQNKLKITTVCWVADNPFDSMRFKWFPMNLQYFDYLFLGDMIWYQNVQNLAPNAKIHQLVGAVDIDYFQPVTISERDRKNFECNLAFAGSAYGMKAEATYRVGILDQIADFGLNIWGDDQWDRFFHYYPTLHQCYRGRRLNFNELNQLYQCASINLNIPNPQCLTTFQQRTFEIAAAKGFQIIDYRKDLDKFFPDNKIITFKSISELREKISYFLKYPSERDEISEQLFAMVIDKHTYEKRMVEMLEITRI